MKTRLIKSNQFFLLAAFFMVCSLSAFGKSQGEIKKKEISQWFNVSSDNELQVDNRFGNITVTHWSKNEVAIRVEVECKASDKKRVQENLDRIRIDIKKEGGIVSAITTIKESNRNSGNGSMTINYYIQMPAKFTSKLTQKYGNINLPHNNNGRTDIHIKYGNLNAGDFVANLTIESKYGNIEVGNLQKGVLDLGYVGNAKINSVQDLSIESKYSNMKFKSADKLSINMKYGNLAVENLNRIQIEAKYSDVEIGLLKQSLEVDELGYSNLEINNLSSSFDKVRAKSHYGNLHIRLPEKSSFKVVAENMKYGNCYVKGFNITDHRKDQDTHTYEINGGGKRIIHFEGNKYGNLKIKAN